MNYNWRVCCRRRQRAGNLRHLAQSLVAARSSHETVVERQPATTNVVTYHLANCISCCCWWWWRCCRAGRPAAAADSLYITRSFSEDRDHITQSKHHHHRPAAGLRRLRPTLSPLARPSNNRISPRPSRPRPNCD